MIDTPWGGIKVADAHVHFFSPPFFKALADQKHSNEVGSLLGWETPATAEALAQRWHAELDAQQVGSAMLIASTPGDVESVGTAVDMFPERFHSVLMVNPVLTGSDLRCAAALSEGEVHGIFLFPAMHQYSMHDVKVHSLLSIVAGNGGALVYVHCGMLSLGFRKKLGLSSLYDMRYSNPIDLHASALAFPHLPFVIPHFGAGYFREALMVAAQCPNIYFDTSGTNSWMRCSPYPTDLAGVFRKALDVVGPERILFGSDSSWFPRGWVRDVFDLQVLALSEVGISTEAARAIFGGNLRKMLELR